MNEETNEPTRLNKWAQSLLLAAAGVAVYALRDGDWIYILCGIAALFGLAVLLAWVVGGTNDKG